MDWKDLALLLAGFGGGIVTSLIKAVMPSYQDLVRENTDLRKECRGYQEIIRGLEDALSDQENL